MATNNITTSTVTINNYLSTYIPTKVCNTCRTIKPLTEFYKCKTCNDGYRSMCKNCCSNYQKELRKEHKNEISKYHQDYYQKNKIKMDDYRKEYYQQNKDEYAKYRQEYYKENKIKILEQNKEYNILNKDKMDKIKREYRKNRRTYNPIYRLIEINRRQINESLHYNKKATSTINLLGCNKEFFYHFIKFLLLYDISDDEFKNNYKIDHVVALENFDLSDQENQFIAFSWQNCRSLLNSKNRSKGAKRDVWSEVMQELQVYVFLKQYYPDEY